MVFVVMVKHKATRAVRVSQEGYKTLVEAQAFCMSREEAEKLNDWCYESKDYLYGIYEVSVKE